MNVSRLYLSTLFVGLTALLSVALSRATPAQIGGIQSQDWTQTTAAELATGEATNVIVTDQSGGELRLVPGATTGVYTSTAITAAFPFNAVAPHWRATVPDGSALRVELRVRTANDGWSPWYPFDDADWSAVQGRFYPEAPLLLSGGQQFQYRVTLTAQVAGRTPLLDEMTVTAIDATSGPTTSQAKAAARPGQVTIQDVPPPTIIPRAAWGVDEDSPTWPPEYRTVEKIVVHHTVTVNGYDEDEAAGWVRAIYDYHTITRGWGDIGYNYLVDSYGNVYEGRYGGPGVVGGHVYGYNYGSVGIGAIGSYGNTGPSEPPSEAPSPETLAALADLAAWEANRSYIHPLESAPFYDVTTYNLTGHRDYGVTSCPGDYLYAKLPGLRQDTWQHIVTYTHQYHVDWLSWNTPPPILLAGETYSPTIRARNVGWFDWPQAGPPNAVRLGYHWLDSEGKEVSQPPEDDHRGPLAYDLTFGHTYDFSPALATTPITPGVYTLAWDMVHEGVAWFHAANAASPLLTTTVVVTDTPPVAIAGRLLDVRGRPVGDGRVALPNWITVTAAADGAYTLSRLARDVYTLTASAEGYASLPAAHGIDATGGDVTYPFVLAPGDWDGLIANGDFEDGLIGWTRGGVAANLPVSTTAAHTGLGAARLGGGVFSGAVWLSQAVVLPLNALTPTLSLLYRAPVVGDGAVLQVALDGEAATLTHTLPLTTTGWTHFWTDLPDGWGGALDLQIRLTQSGSLSPTTALIDEVWLGHHGLEPHLVYLPLILDAHTASAGGLE
jgi:hypothetical protein